MSPSSAFVLAAAIMFLVAAGFAFSETVPPALPYAYLSLFFANLAFSLL